MSTDAYIRVANYIYTASCEVEEMPHANSNHTNDRITRFPVATIFNVLTQTIVYYA